MRKSGVVGERGLGKRGQIWKSVPFFTSDFNGSSRFFEVPFNGTQCKIGVEEFKGVWNGHSVYKE